MVSAWRPHSWPVNGENRTPNSEPLTVNRVRCTLAYSNFGMNSLALETLLANFASRETHRSTSAKSIISTVECMYRIGIDTSALGMPRFVG
jgi:hypothetical protein